MHTFARAESDLRLTLRRRWRLGLTSRRVTVADEAGLARRTAASARIAGIVRIDAELSRSGAAIRVSERHAPSARPRRALRVGRASVARAIGRVIVARRNAGRASMRPQLPATTRAFRIGSRAAFDGQRAPRRRRWRPRRGRRRSRRGRPRRRRDRLLGRRGTPDEEERDQSPMPNHATSLCPFLSAYTWNGIEMRRSCVFDTPNLTSLPTATPCKP